jgi:hypothetical protein
LDDTQTDRVRAAINSLAAAFDVAAKPTLLAREIVRVMDLSGYSRHSGVVETTDLVLMESTNATVGLCFR